MIEFLFSFEGRVSRGQFWGFQLAMMITSIIVGSFAALIQGDGVGLHYFFIPLFMITALWASIAIYVKRLHDLGKPGTWFFLLLVPIANIWVFILCGFFKGVESNDAQIS